MMNISEYDERQLRLMYENLIYFETQQIDLSSLISSLEFLLNTLESNDEKWEEKILNEITTLETINALAVIKDAGEEIMEIQNDTKLRNIHNSIKNLKSLIELRAFIQ